MKAEINETGNRKSIQKINENKSWGSLKRSVKSIKFQLNKKIENKLLVSEMKEVKLLQIPWKLKNSKGIL